MVCQSISVHPPVFACLWRFSWLVQELSEDEYSQHLQDYGAEVSNLALIENLCQDPIRQKHDAEKSAVIKPLKLPRGLGAVSHLFIYQHHLLKYADNCFSGRGRVNVMQIDSIVWDTSKIPLIQFHLRAINHLSIYRRHRLKYAGHCFSCSAWACKCDADRFNSVGNIINTFNSIP